MSTQKKPAQRTWEKPAELFTYEQPLEDFNYLDKDTLSSPLWLEYQALMSIARWKWMLGTTRTGSIYLGLYADDKKSSFEFVSNEDFLKFLKQTMQHPVAAAGKVNAAAVLEVRTDK